jgi:hypothetical protein
MTDCEFTQQRMRGHTATAALCAATLTALVTAGCDRPKAAPDVCANADGALTNASFVFVTAPHSGDRVTSGFAVRGCSRTFEANVPWRLLDAAGKSIARGATTGGGDGPGPFNLTVGYSVAKRQIGHLEIGDEDVSDGEATIKPVQNVIPLVLLP